MDVEQLARAFQPRHLIGELTSRCNLRCRYCQKASDDWNAVPGRDSDASKEVIDQLIGSMAKLRFDTIQLSGIGEMTFRKDWMSLVDTFNDLGTAVTLISNFARPLSEAEYDALLKLQNLMVSIDTMDAELLKAVRRAAPLATIVTNLIKLRMRAKRRRVALPYIRLNAVVYAENALAFEELALFAVETRVNEMQYARMEPQGDMVKPSELHTISRETAREALQQIANAKDILKRGGVVASFHGDLMQTIEGAAA